MGPGVAVGIKALLLQTHGAARVGVRVPSLAERHNFSDGLPTLKGSPEAPLVMGGYLQITRPAMTLVVDWDVEKNKEKKINCD